MSGDKECHIDYFFTRNLFPDKTFDYRNMFVACNAEKYGAKYKDKHIKGRSDYEKLVNPAEESPAQYMEYAFTGELHPIDHTGKGAATIDCFNLNERSLVRRRIDAIYFLQSMKSKLSEEESVEATGEFETMIRQLYKEM